MSTSTDAIIAYGIKIEDFKPEYDEDSGEMLLDSELKDADLELVLHCSDSLPMYFLAAFKSVKKAWRGSPVHLTAKNLEEKSEWEENIKAFAKKHKIKTTGSVGWHIMSYWC